VGPPTATTNGSASTSSGTTSSVSGFPWFACRSLRDAASASSSRVAARNQLLRTRGLNAARDLASRLEQTLREKDMQADTEPEDDVEHGGQV